jgi:RNA-directed DNA polymerase
VLDGLIQQAVMQVLQRRWDRTFSDLSYGFRPGRSAHQVLEAAQKFVAAGYRSVADLDCGEVLRPGNHDKLTAKIAERVSDKRLLKLIREFLRVE